MFLTSQSFLSFEAVYPFNEWHSCWVTGSWRFLIIETSTNQKVVSTCFQVRLRLNWLQHNSFEHHRTNGFQAFPSFINILSKQMCTMVTSAICYRGLHSALHSHVRPKDLCFECCRQWSANYTRYTFTFATFSLSTICAMICHKSWPRVSSSSFVYLFPANTVQRCDLIPTLGGRVSRCKFKSGAKIWQLYFTHSMGYTWPSLTRAASSRIPDLSVCFWCLNKEVVLYYHCSLEQANKQICFESLAAKPNAVDRYGMFSR